MPVRIDPTTTNAAWFALSVLLRDSSRTKVELTQLAKWRMVLLRRDLTPGFLVLAKAVLKSNRRRFQNAGLSCYEVSYGNRRDRASTSICG
jgi:hypothetical protein